MKNRLYSVFILIVLFSIVLYPQTEMQVKQQLEKSGIHSKADIDAELQKRNMTEDDARRLAKQYGMNYDDFISEYVMKTKKSDPGIQTPAENVKEEKITPVDVQTAVVEENLKPELKEKIELTERKEEKSKKSEYFGYDIFKNIPAAFEPASVGPVDPGYLIGPGDELRLYMWGDVEFQYNLTVDQVGNIFIPTAGQVFVLGIQYSQLQQKMTNYLSKFYEGLVGNPPTVFLDISISKLRPIKVFALGEVKQPGGYDVSSFSTVFNALYSIGGPLESGSMREIKIIRNNKTETTVDLYDYLLNGEIKNDARLRNNDIIFISPRKSTVQITGEILRPYIYELVEGEGILELVKFAGGLKATAFTDRVQIKRIIPYDKRKQNQFDMEIIDINLTDIMKNRSSNFFLQNGDEVIIYPILDEIENYVAIEGAVYRPGTYEYKEGKRLMDLVNEAYGLLPQANLGKVDVIRTLPNKKNEFFTVDLSKAQNNDSENNILLFPRDQIKIYSIYEIEERMYVSIEGYVKNPFTIQYADSLTLYDMIYRAGGLLDPMHARKAYTARGDIIRLNPDRITTTIIHFDLEKVLNDPSYNIDIEPGDAVKIYKGDVDKIYDKYVTVKGEVRQPGVFRLSENMSPLDAVIQAGGFQDNADKTQIYVNRIDPLGMPGDTLSHSFNITVPVIENEKGEYLIDISKVNSKDFLLQQKDVIVVRKNPYYEEQRVVKITGEVKYPGTYVLMKKNQKISELLSEAGGPTSEAFLYGTYFSRGNKRVALDMEKVYYNEDEDEDIFLKNGDSIYVPATPNTVFLTGEVNNEGLFKYIPGDDVKDYIKRAGGETNDADYIILYSADGSSKRINFGFLSSNPEVKDGAIIKVTKTPPPQPETEKFDVGATIRDVFAIMSAALTIIVLSKQL
ncbi:MAG: hypothetical protein GXX85_11895 [Ignavibacteria bacterium]|nr:hypothetical protein [Ignavibacteria bacterium]